MAGASWWSLAATQSWQLAVLVAAVALASRTIARNRPHLAHALWLVVLVKCVLPPVWSSPTGLFCWLRYAPPAPSAASRDDILARGSIAISLANRADSRGATLTLPADADRPARIITSTGRASEDQDSSPQAPASALAYKETRWFNFGLLLLTAWGAGSIVVAFVAILRLLACWRKVRQGPARHDPALDQLVRSLARRLGLRRPVRLLVSESRVGPAVIGLLRPTILLPACVAAGRTPEELEPILAHELIHVRRGDLWVGLLDVTARAVWWFHPLVWLAGRALAREAERCCDEEVIGSLGYAPARYARSLLDVLELKRILVAVPAFPGVRPVEITSQRLERIMSLGQGCRRRASWRCWCVMLGAAALALPGAALVVAATEPEKQVVAEGAGQDEITRSAYASAKVPQPVLGQLADCETEPPAIPASWITKEYDVADLVESFRRTPGVAEDVAKKLIASDLEGTLATDRQFGLYARDSLPEKPSERSGSASPVFTWSGKSIQVRYSPAGQRRVALALADIRQRDYGHQIAVGVRWVSLGGNNNELIKSLSNSWKLLPCAPSGEDGLAEVDEVFPEIRASRGSHASFTMRRDLPILYDVLDAMQVQAALASLERDKRNNWLAAPNITMFSGQTGILYDVKETPFVVDFRDAPGGGQQPVIRVCHEGTALRLKAKPHDDLVRLEYEMVYSSIGKVDTIRLPTAGAPTLEVPEVARTHFQSSIDLPIGKTLAIGGLGRITDKGIADQMVVLLTVMQVFESEQEKDARPAGEPKPSEPESDGISQRERVNAASGERPTVIYETQKGAGPNGQDRALVVHEGLGKDDASQDDGERAKAADDSAEDSAAARTSDDKPPLVAEIRIEGNSTIAAQKITPHVKTCAGNMLDETVVDHDVNRLMKTGRFVSVEPRYEPAADGRTIVIFRVVERPTIRYLKISGRTGPEKLLAKKAGLKVGDPLDPAAVEEAKTKLEEYLRHKAYADAKVTILEGTEPGDRGVRMLVSEGEKQMTWSTGIDESASVADEPGQAAAPPPADTVRGSGFGIIFGTKQKRAANADQPAPATRKAPVVLSFEGKVDQQQVRDQARRLTEHYRALGFLTAKVEPLVLEDANRDDSWTINFTIDEGPRFVVANVSFIGCKSFAADELAASLETKSGDFFNGQKLEKDSAAIKARYDAAGHAEPAVTVETRFPEEPGKVEVVYKIAEENPLAEQALPANSKVR